MRRSLKFALLAVVAVSLPVVAQRGGAHAGFSGHAFSGRAFSGHGGASGHSIGGGMGMRPFSGGVRGAAFAPNHRSFSYRSPSPRPPLASRNVGSRRPHPPVGLRSRSYGYGRYGHRNHCDGFYGCGYGYPWIGAAFDPYWWWDSGSQDQDQQQIDRANEMNELSLDEQAGRQQGNQDAFARSSPPLGARRPEPGVATPATVLVFRDQRKLEIQNYAIIGQTLWNFAPQRSEKISLSDLDLPATAKENEERGVDFRLPGGSEGQ